eukprot:85126-Pleurochrysis_carterae.AAC.8
MQHQQYRTEDQATYAIIAHFECIESSHSHCSSSLRALHKLKLLPHQATQSLMWASHLSCTYKRYSMSHQMPFLDALCSVERASHAHRESMRPALRPAVIHFAACYRPTAG